MSLLESASTAVHSVLGLDDVDGDRLRQTVHVGDRVPQALGEDLPLVVRVQRAPDATEQLLLAVANGDREALVALKSRVGGLVRANIRRVLRDASRSDAVAQAFFAEVARDASAFDPDRDSAQAWLLTRAHQRATSWLTSGHAASHRTDRPRHLEAGSVDDLGHSGEPAL